MALAKKSRKKRKADSDDPTDPTSQYYMDPELISWFTDNLPLADYAQILHLVPRLVNVVTVRRALQRAVERPQTHQNEAHQPQNARLVHKHQKYPQWHYKQNPPHEDGNNPGDGARLLQ